MCCSLHRFGLHTLPHPSLARCTTFRRKPFRRYDFWSHTTFSLCEFPSSMEIFKYTENNVLSSYYFPSRSLEKQQQHPPPNPPPPPPPQKNKIFDITVSVPTTWKPEPGNGSFPWLSRYGSGLPWHPPSLTRVFAVLLMGSKGPWPSLYGQGGL